MSNDNEKKVKLLAFKMSFIMEHQMVLPELLDLAESLKDDQEFYSDPYLKGAFDALTTLVVALRQKGE